MSKEYFISSNKYSTSTRQTKSGKVYDIVFRVTDPETLETTQKKLSGFKTKGEAKQAYLEFVTEHCELVRDLPQRREAKEQAEKEKADKLLVADLVKQYFEALPNQIKDATIYEKQKLFDLMILPRFASMDIRDITKQELYKWQDELWTMRNPKTNSFYSYKYLSKIRTYFSAFLSWCAVRYASVQNNLLTVQKPKRRAPQKKMQFWTREEFDRFIACVDKPLYHAMFTMLFFTGRRKGEILALTKEDIDIEKGAIAFNKSITRKTMDGNPYNVTSTKTELESTTPICETLLTEIKAYEGGDPFYFGGKNPISDNTLRREFNKYASKAGLKQIRIHDLRHSFVSMCIHLGATIPVVADLIGDTIAQVTKTYAHLYESDKKSIIAKIG